MTADELWDHYHPPTPAQAFEIARAFLSEQGDLPKAVWYELGFVQQSGTQAEVWNALKLMRAAHFERLGQPVPDDYDEQGESL